MCAWQQTGSRGKRASLRARMSEASERTRICVEVMKKMACERLLSSFMAVAPTVRDRFPSSMIRAISAYDVTSSLALGRIQQPGGECAAWLRGAARETATHLERSST